MRGLIDSFLVETVHKRLQNNPAVAILCLRQCGKTNLAGQSISRIHQSVYMDLENPADLAKLDDPLAFFGLNHEDLVCLDEIQHVREFLSYLQSDIDARPDPGRFILTGVPMYRCFPGDTFSV